MLFQKISGDNGTLDLHPRRVWLWKCQRPCGRRRHISVAVRRRIFTPMIIEDPRNFPDLRKFSALQNFRSPAMSDAQHPEPPQPRQEQAPSGETKLMTAIPDHGEVSYQGSGLLSGKVALITGGSSGIGRAVAAIRRCSVAQDSQLNLPAPMSRWPRTKAVT